ncbi:unnamed protein product [Aphanomyces euteiches]
MVVTRTTERIKRDEEEEARQIAEALALSESQPVAVSDAEVQILDMDAVNDEASFVDPSWVMNKEPKTNVVNRRLYRRLLEMTTRQTEARTMEVARLAAVREKNREEDRKMKTRNELNLAARNVEYEAAMRQTQGQSERCTELGYHEGVVNSRFLTYKRALSEVIDLIAQCASFLPCFKTLLRQRKRLKDLETQAEGDWNRLIYELRQAENLFQVHRQDYIARRHPGLLHLPLASLCAAPPQTGPFDRPPPQVLDIVDEEETKEEPIFFEILDSPPRDDDDQGAIRTQGQTSFLQRPSMPPSPASAEDLPPIRKFRRLKRGAEALPNSPRPAKVSRASAPPTPPSPTTTIASAAPSTPPARPSNRRHRSEFAGHEDVQVGPRITLRPADSDEEPFDPYEANLDRRNSTQPDPNHLPSYALDRSLEDMSEDYQSMVNEAVPPMAPDFARSVYNAVSHIGNVLRTMVNTQPNIRRPLRLSATEIRENHAKLTRIVNEYVAPPQPSPADGRLCQGRMSDGSKCQLPASKCYLRAQGVHVSTPGVMPRCFGKSIKPGLNRRCNHKWPRCQVHNPKYHEIFNRFHGHATRAQKDYGNRQHDFVQDDKVVVLEGPHFPTAHSFSRHVRRLQDLDTHLESLAEPDTGSQGPPGPLDQHPGPKGPSPNPPGPPPASVGGPSAIYYV